MFLARSLARLTKLVVSLKHHGKVPSHSSHNFRQLARDGLILVLCHWQLIAADLLGCVEADDEAAGFQCQVH